MAVGELTDAALEAAIDDAFLLCSGHPDLEQRRAAFERMRRLIAQRNPERIAEMEREKGLRQ